MRNVWLTLSLMAVVTMFAAFVEAQRFPTVMNPNTHEGKYSTGGIGLSLGGGIGIGDSLHRETAIGNADFSRFENSLELDRSTIIFGVAIDFQVGSDSDIVGVNFSLEMYSFSISSGDTLINSVITEVSHGATTMFLGGDFLINFLKSEFIETDGRRTREDFGLGMIVGLDAGLMFGDFEDLNGFASVGLNLGVIADIPIPISGAEDLLQISPFIMFEANYRLGVTNELDTVDLANSSLRLVENNSFDGDFFLNTDDSTTAVRDGIAIRRHNFIPAFQLSVGADVNLTPIFIGRAGNIINNWRFNLSVTASLPLKLNAFAADEAGDPLWAGSGDTPFVAMVAFGAGYFW
ncbi:MAG: hypothetical protein V3V10_05545 [Planctomycetota bacterium]